MAGPPGPAPADSAARQRAQAGQYLGARRAAGLRQPAPARRPAGQRQLARVVQRAGQRLVGGQLARRLGRGAQHPAQPPQAERVGAAERPGQQLGGASSVSAPGRSAQREQHQQRPGARLGGQRQLVAGDGDRHPGRGQRPLQHRAPGGPPTGPGPPSTTTARPSIRCARRSVSAISAASWLALAAVATRTSPAGRARAPAPGPGAAGRRRPGHAPPAAARPLPGRDAALRHPGRHPARGGQQHRPAAAAGAQRDHLGRPAVRCAEPLREAPDALDVRAAERVDRLVRVADRDQLPRRRRPAGAASPPAPGRCPGTRRRRIAS